MTEPTNHAITTSAPPTEEEVYTRDNRQTRFETMFNQTTPLLQQNLDLKKVLRRYEELHQKESRLWWEASTLKKYCTERIVPRGLRLRKLPTTVFSPEFLKKWEEILLEASLSLMGLIIDEETAILKEQEVEMERIKGELKGFETMDTYQDLMKETKDRIEKMERAISDTKHRKYTRDMEDFHLGRIYNWSRKGELKKKPILKKKKSRKEVKFPTLGSSEGSVESIRAELSSVPTSEDSSMSEGSKNGDPKTGKTNRRMNLRSTTGQGGQEKSITKKGKT